MFDRLGLEREFILSTQKDELLGASVRDAFVHKLEGIAKAEFGAAQIELVTAPFQIDESLPTHLASVLAKQDESLITLSTTLGVKVNSTGLWPAKVHQIEITPTRRNIRIRGSLNRRRRKDSYIGCSTRVQCSDSAIAGLTNGLHVNLSTTTLDQAVEIANHAMSISPIIISLSGNSPRFNGCDLGLSSSRLAAYEACVELGHGGPALAGLPSRYFQSISCFEKHVNSLPVVDGEQLVWNDVRIKQSPTPIVECRFVDMQSCSHKTRRIVLLLLGLLAHSVANLPLIPWDSLVLDRQTSIRDGRQGWLRLPWRNAKRCNVTDCFDEIVDTADEGLRSLGIRDQLSEIARY